MSPRTTLRVGKCANAPCLNLGVQSTGRMNPDLSVLLALFRRWLCCAGLDGPRDRVGAVRRDEAIDGDRSIEWGRRPMRTGGITFRPGSRLGFGSGHPR